MEASELTIRIQPGDDGEVKAVVDYPEGALSLEEHHKITGLVWQIADRMRVERGLPSWGEYNPSFGD